MLTGTQGPAWLGASKAGGVEEGDEEGEGEAEEGAGGDGDGDGDTVGDVIDMPLLLVLSGALCIRIHSRDIRADVWFDSWEHEVAST